MTVRQLYLQDPITQRIRLTNAGLSKYGVRFAKAGFHHKAIKTLKDLEAAIDASFTNEMVRLAATEKGKHSELDLALNGLPGW